MKDNNKYVKAQCKSKHIIKKSPNKISNSIKLVWLILVSYQFVFI